MYGNLAWGIGRVSKLFGYDQEGVQRKMRELFNLPNSATNREKIEVVAKQIRLQIARTTTLHYSFKDCVLFHWAYSKTPSEMFQMCVMVAVLCVIHQGIKSRRISKIRKLDEFKRAMARSGQQAVAQNNLQDYYSGHLNYYDIADTTALEYSEFIGGGSTLPETYRRVMALYYGFQVLIEICLAICAFSFNVWILLAIIVGETFGYWLLLSEPMDNPIIME